MKRYRTIKRDLWSDEKVFRVSIGARLLFIGLFSTADDHGLLQAAPLVLKGNIYAYDETTYSQIAGWLVELHQAGLIRLYGTPGMPFAQVINFGKHQNQRTIQPPTCPTPGSRNNAGFQPGDLQAFTAIHSSDSSLDDEIAARKVGEGKVRDVEAREDAHLSEQVNPPTTESFAIEQAIAIFVDCSKGGIDESMWRSLIDQHRTRHVGAPAERYVDAAMQMRAKALDSGRPFSMNAGWKWFELAWRSLADDEHQAARRRITVVQNEPKRRTAADLLAEQDRIWSAPA
jgi:hypothetical protein